MQRRVERTLPLFCFSPCIEKSRCWCAVWDLDERKQNHTMYEYPETVPYRFFKDWIKYYCQHPCSVNITVCTCCMPLNRHLQKLFILMSENSSVSTHQQWDLHLTFHALGQLWVDTELLSRSDQMEAKVIKQYWQIISTSKISQSMGLTDFTRCACWEFHCCYWFFCLLQSQLEYLY